MTGETFSRDCLDLFRCLTESKVKALIVGGQAVIYYGFPRLTGDIDLFYENTRENVHRLWNALDSFWEGSIPGIESSEELRIQGMVFQFGMPPNRIDLINQIEGVDFGGAWEERTDEKIRLDDKEVTVHYIGLDALIRNKSVLSRPKDLEDLKYLEEAKKIR